jgi:hypothetical protein
LPTNYTQAHDTVLRRQVESAQDTNIRLRALAEQLVADIHTIKHDDGSPLSRPTFDQLLLTAHQRVKAHAA